MKITVSAFNFHVGLTANFCSVLIWIWHLVVNKGDRWKVLGQTSWFQDDFFFLKVNIFFPPLSVPHRNNGSKHQFLDKPLVSVNRQHFILRAWRQLVRSLGARSRGRWGHLEAVLKTTGRHDSLASKPRSLLLLKRAPGTSSTGFIPELIRNSETQASDLLNQNLHFNEV